MKNENLTKSQSQQKGTKAKGSVGHGINNTALSLPSDDSASFEAEEKEQPIDYSDFPIRVRMILRELADVVYDDALIKIADYFSYFNSDVQNKMAKFLLEEYFEYGPNLLIYDYTGVPFLDNVLKEIVDTIVNGYKPLKDE